MAKPTVGDEDRAERHDGASSGEDGEQDEAEPVTLGDDVEAVVTMFADRLSPTLQASAFQVFAEDGEFSPAIMERAVSQLGVSPDEVSGYVEQIADGLSLQATDIAVSMGVTELDALFEELNETISGRRAALAILSDRSDRKLREFIADFQRNRSANPVHRRP